MTCQIDKVRYVRIICISRLEIYISSLRMCISSLKTCIFSLRMKLASRQAHDSSVSFHVKKRPAQVSITVYEEALKKYCIKNLFFQENGEKWKMKNAGFRGLHFHLKPAFH